jgi:hypothetical protein
LKILVAKSEKRLREQDKETVFFHNGRGIPAERIDNFRKRRFSKRIEAASPGAGKLAGLVIAYRHRYANLTRHPS